MAGSSPAMTVWGALEGNNMKKMTSMICAALLLLAGSVAAQEGDKTVPKLTVVLATATQGGGFPLYGNAFAEVMMQADPTLVIETRNTMGSSENIPSLEAHKSH